MARVLLAVLLLAHGVAHLPGFVVAWRLRELPDLPYTTAVFGKLIDIGTIGTRVLGVAWLLAALAWIAVAVGIFARTTLAACPDQAGRLTCG